MTRSLDDFPDEFLAVQAKTVKFSEERPSTVQQALVVMDDEYWNRMVSRLFEDYDRDEVVVNDVMSMVRETNTCEGPDSELNVWIDEAGDFKIKVYCEVL